MKGKKGCGNRMFILRRCRVLSLVPLMLFLSLINTVIIFMFLVPHHVQNEFSTEVMANVRKTASTEAHPDIKSTKQLPKNNNGGSEPKTSQKVKNNSAVARILEEPEIEEEFFGHTFMRKQLKFQRDAMLMVGKPPEQPVQLVIGIPTVKRNSKDYLSSTLEQLLRSLSEKDKKSLHIVVFSADTNVSLNRQIADKIKKSFENEVNSGLIEVVKPDKGFYPKFENLPLLWKDKPERIKWRSKQCIDYALMFVYCRTLGKYYLQLEDDLLVTDHYFTHIMQFIEARESYKWSNLEFGTTGFIGMLLRTSSLARLALFVKMYYSIYPVDILFRHFNDVHLYGNSAYDKYSPSLFLHLGAESSLKGQKRKLDPSVKNKLSQINNRVYNATNPTAKVTTNIQVFGKYTIDGPYKTKELGYFWGKDIKVSDYVLLEFEREILFLKVAVDSGSEFAIDDIIEGAKFDATTATKDGKCNTAGYVPLVTNTFRARVVGLSPKPQGTPAIKCLRMTITKLHEIKKKKTWLVVREIAVWSK